MASLIASPLELAVLAAAAIAVALLLRLAKFPASWMFGAMIASAVLHGTGLIEGGLPPWMRGVALVGIGAVIGTRFARISKSTLLSHINAGLGSFAVAIAISAVFVTVIVLATNVRFADVVVAFAPGRDGRHAGAGAHAAYRSDFRRRPSSVALRVRLDHDAGDRASVRTAAGGCGRLRPSWRIS